MKKFCRMISVALLLSILASFCFSAFSAHALLKDGISNYDFGNGAYGSYNEKTKTLTIHGTGEFPCPATEIYQRNDKAINDWRYLCGEMTTLIVEGEITRVHLDNYVDTVVLGKNIKQSPVGGYVQTAFKVDPQNPYLADYDGVLYSKDYKNLIRCPINKTTIKFHPNTQVIKDSAFAQNNLTSPIVFPWGLQKIEDFIFNNRVDAVTVVMPDTLLPGQRTGAFHATLYCSTKKQADIVPFQSESDDVCIVDDKKTYDYYGVKPNSLHTFENGKTYFFGPNYEYAKGWKQASGNWYYFNDYGAAVVKIWLKSGNKWYFMQADGTMATNKWVQWYNKWYYVGSDGAMYANRWIKSSGKWYYLGSDGAMYTNRYTPDGCWVNGSGVWVK